MSPVTAAAGRCWQCWHHMQSVSAPDLRVGPGQQHGRRGPAPPGRSHRHKYPGGAAERPGPVWSQAQGNVDTFCSKIVRPPTLLHSSHPPAAALNLKLVKNFMICPGQWWWYWLWYWWWWWPHGGHQLLCPAQQQLSAWCLAGELQLCFAAQ